jgi:hypothetical protein
VRKRFEKEGKSLYVEGRGILHTVLKYFETRMYGDILVETAYRYEEVICEKMINCTDSVELRKKRIHFYKARCKLWNKISQIKVEISRGVGCKFLL